MLFITEANYATNLLDGGRLSRRQSYLYTDDQHASCTYEARSFIEVLQNLSGDKSYLLRPRFIPVLSYSPLSIYLSLVLFPGKNDNKVVHVLTIKHLSS
jgi:hypothetical protein